MEPASQAHAPEELNAPHPTCATRSVNLTFSPDHVGPPSIVAGLRNLASGASQTETWVIAQPVRPDHPDRIIAQYTVEIGREQTSDSPVWVVYCGREGKGDQRLVQRLLPPSQPQDIEYACAQLCALLCSLAERHSADILRIADTARIANDGPAIISLPAIIWYRLATRGRKRKLVTIATLRRRLRRAQPLSREAADRVLESHARGTGLIKIGEEWFAAVATYVLPPLSRDDYDRIVRALRAHARECNGDRLRHGAIGNYGAARALASEEIAARRELDFIESSTAKFP